MKKIGYRDRIGSVRFYRRIEDDKSIYHYTTKILEVKDNEIMALDGFSVTDSIYVESYLRLHGLYDYHVIRRVPRNGNAIFVIESPEGILVPKMSFDIAFFDRDTARFYFKPLKYLGYGDVDTLRENVKVLSAYGEVEPDPEYLPWLKELSCDKPDCTITVYDGRRDHIFDIYGSYYFKVDIVERPFFGRWRVLEWMGYTRDLVKLGVLPPLEVRTVQIDGWRSRSETVFKGAEQWHKISDYEWAGMFSESEEQLAGLREDLKRMVDLGVFDLLATVIHYTSNIFVTYVDFYVKAKEPNGRVIKVLEEELSDLRRLQMKEILENIFPSLKRD